MESLKPDEIALNTAAMYNRLTRTHNAQVQDFGAEGMSGNAAGLASYIALRLMLENIEQRVRDAVGEAQWSTIEAIVSGLKETIVPVEMKPYKPKVSA